MLLVWSPALGTTGSQTHLQIQQLKAGSTMDSTEEKRRGKRREKEGDGEKKGWRKTGAVRI